MYIGGWDFPGESTMSAADNSFQYIVPSKYLFAIFTSYNRVTCGKQTISLGATKVVHIFQNDEIKLKLFLAQLEEIP